MSSWARVGAKCVCVDDSPGRDSGLPVPFTKGQVLEIREIVYHGGLRFIGIPDFDHRDRMYTSFDSARFRPLITKSQEDDIPMFKSLLKPTEVPA